MADIDDELAAAERLQELKESLVDLTRKLQQERKDSLKTSQKETDKLKDQAIELAIIVAKLQKAGKLSAVQVQNLSDAAASAKEFSDKQTIINNKFKKSGTTLEKFMNTALAKAITSAGGLVDEVDRFIDMLPGGKTLTRLLGVNELKESLNKAFNKGMDAFVNSLDAGKDSTTALKDGMKAFGSSAKGTLMTVGLIAAGILAIVGMMKIIKASFEFVRNLEKEFSEISANTGLAFSQSKKLAELLKGLMNAVLSAQEALNKNILISNKEVLAVSQELIKDRGTIVGLDIAAAAAVAQTAEAFGYSAKSAAQVAIQLEDMGMNAKEAAKVQQEIAAEALKSGVNVGAVMDDIAKSSKIAAKFFGGNTKQLAKSAIEAAKLGTNLDGAAKVANKLLDIEGSLTAQFEFMALSGKEINLDLARQLALQGDIVGATEQVLNQVGDINEFNKLDVLERQALADATGMDVAELQKSLVIRDKLKNATKEQLAAVAGLGLSAAEMEGMTSQELENRIAQEQSMKNMDKSIERMKAAFQQFIAPLVEGIAESMTNIVTLFQDVLGFIFGASSGATNLADKLKTVGRIIGALLPAIIVFAAVLTGAAIASAIASLSSIPVIGPALGIGAGIAILAAIVGGIAQIKSVGDLGIDPNGGPIVSSPQMGGIFQGKKGDGLSMGPGMGTSPDLGNASSSGGNNMAALEAKFDKMISLLGNIAITSQNPPPVQIGTQVIDEIGTAVEIQRGYQS